MMFERAPVRATANVSFLCALFACFCARATVAVSADNVELRTFPASRYAPLIAASPFALDTRAIAPPVDEPNPFADFVIVTLAQIHDPATGTHDIVTIRSRKEPPTFWTLEGKTPNCEGIQVTRIDWSERVGETKVVIKKGAQMGTVEFDKAAMHPTAPPVMTGPGSATQTSPRANSRRLPERTPVVSRARR
jgi:hypothetical protein